jgi:hypothetical protein
MTMIPDSGDEPSSVLGDQWVPRTRPPSSGDHLVPVGEAAQAIGSS